MDSGAEPHHTEIRALRERVAELERQLAESRTTFPALTSPEGNSKLQRFDHLFAHSRDIILFVRHNDGQIVDANPAALKAYGFSFKEMLALTIQDLRAADTHDSAAAQMARANAAGILFETVHRRKDGSTFPVEVSSQGATIGDERTLISIIRDISERTRAQAERERLLAEVQQEKIAAQQHAEELNAIIESLHDPVMVYNRDGVIYRVNASAIRAHGFDPSSHHRDEANHSLTIRRPDGSLARSDELPSARALKGEFIHNERYEVTNDQGRDLSLLLTAMPLIVHGVQTGAVSVWHDVTEQNRSAQALQRVLEQAEEGRLLLEALMENIPEGITITGGPPDFPIIKVSRYGLGMTGHQFPADLMGISSGQHQNTWGIYLSDGETLPTPEQMPLYRAGHLGEVVQNEEMVMRRDDGTRIPVLVNAAPIRDSQGRIVAAINAWRDFSERKQAEEDLRESEDRLRNVLENLPQGIIVIDPNDATLQWNQEALRMHGYSQQEDELDLITSLANLYQTTTLDGEELHFDQWPIARILHGEDFRDFELVVCKTQEDWRRVFSYQGKLIRDLNGQPSMGVLSIHDITARKQAEEALADSTRQLERSNRDLEQFAFVASHDLQEPLRKIEAFTDALGQSSSQLDERDRDFLQRMGKAAGRMRAMVDGLLELSRVTTQGQPFSKVDLNRVAGEVITDLDYQIRRTSGTVIVDRLPVVAGDPLQLRQLLQNLIGNALKFHPSGSPPWVRVFAEELPGAVKINIQDRGIGFSPEDAERMFQPFQRLVGRNEYEGSGMGLSICRRIAERHGGEISATSASGQGAVFTITLPVENK